MSQRQLRAEIIRMSVATTWEPARREWDLAMVYGVHEPQTCLCGHHPINEICVITNRHNGHHVEVGNVCIDRFMKLQSKQIFVGIERIRENLLNKLSRGAIEYAHKRGWFNDWELGFYLDVRLKRSLSDKQTSKLTELNQIVLLRVEQDRNSTAIKIPPPLPAHFV